jgi:hypothetical protein
MRQQPRIQMPHKEERTATAIIAIEQNEVLSVRKAAAMYSVPESSLRDRRASKPSRRDGHPNSANLTK